MSDTIESVQLDETGAIAGLVTRAHGVVKGALYIDCTGMRAKLIGEALGQPFRSCRDSLLTDRAVTCQVPYDRSCQPDRVLHDCDRARSGLDVGYRAQ